MWRMDRWSFRTLLDVIYLLLTRIYAENDFYIFALSDQPFERRIAAPFTIVNFKEDPYPRIIFPENFPEKNKLLLRSKRDVLQIDAVECRWSIVCAEWWGETDNRATTPFGRFSLFGHIARMSDETDAEKIYQLPLGELKETTWTPSY